MAGNAHRTRDALRRVGKDPLFPIVYAVFGIGFLAFSMALYAYLHHFDGAFDPKPETWGQFGDYLGGTLNPMLSFLSLLLFVISLMHQRLELKEARLLMAQQVREGAAAARLNALSTALDATNAMLAASHGPKSRRDVFLHETAELRREAILREILTTVDVRIPSDEEDEEGLPS